MKLRNLKQFFCFVLPLLIAQQSIANHQVVIPSPHPQLGSALHSIDKDVWLHQQHLSYHALDAIDFIQSAFVHGLNPENYHYSQLHYSAQSETEFITLLTDGLLKLIHDLDIGHINPEDVDAQWFIPRDKTDALAHLINAIHSRHLKATLAQLAPTHPAYFHLQTALSQYRAYVSRGGWNTIPPLPLIRPMEKHAGIALIRQRLSVEEVALQTYGTEDSDYYDEQLLAAVKRFQQRNGLKIDGIIGRDTLTALNIPAEQRVKQIKLNLERLRWLPQQLGQRYLMVNIANYWLKAFENGRSALNMRVIVGKQKRPTPSFSSNMSHIVFNPYWNVPNKLARLDLLPKQQTDPDYFYLNKFRIFLKSEPSQEVDPYLVDWPAISAHHFPYRLQQLPGQDNALGQMKFIFPNPWNIYLHDTPNHALFDKHQRNFSSGCIRVEKPIELAEFSLNRSQSIDWIQQQIASEENRGKKLETPLPVYSVYFTVWSDGNAVSFYPDTYKRDIALSKYL